MTVIAPQSVALDQINDSPWPLYNPFKSVEIIWFHINEGNILQLSFLLACLFEDMDL